MLSLPQVFCRSCFKNHASWMIKMYRHNVLQPEFEDFYLPFGGKLRSDNRWVRMAKMIPWDEIESEYAATFSKNGMGVCAFSPTLIPAYDEIQRLHRLYRQGILCKRQQEAINGRCIQKARHLGCGMGAIGITSSRPQRSLGRKCAG